MHTCDIVITCDSWDTKIVNVALNVFTVDDTDADLTDATRLCGNYPNPFNPETEIFFQIPDYQLVEINIYNLKGQLVKTLINDVLPSGDHSVIWKGIDNMGNKVSSGVYFYSLISEETVQTRKMILLK
jgi:hypothetical protein